MNIDAQGAIAQLAKTLNGPHDTRGLHGQAELAQLREISWRNATKDERERATSTAAALLAKFSLIPRAGVDEPHYVDAVPR